MKTAYRAVFEALRPLQDEDNQITAHGKEGQGNQTIRFHYKRDNLLTKVMFRHDLSKLGAESNDVKDYLHDLEHDARYPWTVIPSSAQFNLANIPSVVQINEDRTLGSSLVVNKAVLEALEPLPRKTAYLRQWRADGKGIGIELILVFQSEEYFAVYEVSMNYYTVSNVEQMVEALKKTANPLIVE